jgi:DNA polymerase
MQTLIIDFETSSPRNLKDCGAHNYCIDCSIELLGIVEVGTNVPPTIIDIPTATLLRGPRIKLEKDFILVGHNIRGFDLLLWRRLGLCEPCEVIDTMYLGAILGSSGLTLKQCVADIVTTQEVVKTKINFKTCTKEALIEYLANDVTITLRLFEACHMELSHDALAYERMVWALPEAVMRIDTELARRMIDINRVFLDNINSKLSAITEGKLTSVTQSVAMAKLLGLKSVDKRNLATLESTSPIVALRRMSSKSSIAKATKALQLVDPKTELLHGSIQYYGAHTGRYSGRGFQIHNLPRPSIPDTSGIIADTEALSPEAFIAKYKEKTLEALSSSLRGLVIPKTKGNQFYVADYAQIEARVLAWVAGHSDLLKQFEAKEDIYVNMARAIYSTHNISKEQRTIGKVVCLSCGYGMGLTRFKEYAKVFGIDRVDDSVIDVYRRVNKPITALWTNLERTVIESLLQINTPITCNRLTVVTKTNNSTHIILPSTRAIVYRNLKVHEGRLFMNDKPTWGGVLVENVVQAIARDILCSGMMALERQGYPVSFHVHDEVILEVSSVETKAHLLPIVSEAMCRPNIEFSSYIMTIPLAVEGFFCERYRK